jgi:TetR/AcrR family transcriptional regulator, transcriptional repressor for nem operon
MSKHSLREALLEAGLKTLFASGYNGSGVRDICKAAGAPQGSFTNHFRSKEAFAREVLDRYFDYIKGLVAEALDDPSLSPRDRLRRYLDIITTKLAEAGWSRGCLIGDLSLEAPAHSEMLRTRLTQIYREWREPFAACIAQAQAAGEITADALPEDLADFLLAGWLGSIMRMKVERNSAPLERFKAIAFSTVFIGRTG